MAAMFTNTSSQSSEPGKSRSFDHLHSRLLRSPGLLHHQLTDIHPDQSPPVISSGYRKKGRLVRQNTNYHGRACLDLMKDTKGQHIPQHRAW